MMRYELLPSNRARREQWVHTHRGLVIQQQKNGPHPRPHVNYTRWCREYQRQGKYSAEFDAILHYLWMTGHIDGFWTNRLSENPEEPAPPHVDPGGEGR